MSYRALPSQKLPLQKIIPSWWHTAYASFGKNEGNVADRYYGPLDSTDNLLGPEGSAATKRNEKRRALGRFTPKRIVGLRTLIGKVKERVGRHESSVAIWARESANADPPIEEPLHRIRDEEKQDCSPVSMIIVDAFDAFLSAEMDDFIYRPYF